MWKAHGICVHQSMNRFLVTVVFVDRSSSYFMDNTRASKRNIERTITKRQPGFETETFSKRRKFAEYRIVNFPILREQEAEEMHSLLLFLRSPVAVTAFASNVALRAGSQNDLELRYLGFEWLKLFLINDIRSRAWVWHGSYLYRKEYNQYQYDIIQISYCQAVF